MVLIKTKELQTIHGLITLWAGLLANVSPNSSEIIVSPNMESVDL